VRGALAQPITDETRELLRLHRIHQDRRGNMPTSMDRRDIYLRGFAHWFEPRGLFEATRQDIEAFLDQRRAPGGRKIHSRTRYYWIAHLHAFYRWAVSEELTDHDPTVAIVRPRQRRTLPRPIEGDDLVMAIRGARPQMRAMLSLAAFAGLRCGEIAGLERDDIVEAKGLIRVRHGKGDKERIVPIHPDVMSALRMLPMPKTGALFVRPRGGRHTPVTISVVINAYLKDMGINATAHQGKALVRERDLCGNARHPNDTGADGPSEPEHDSGLHRLQPCSGGCGRGVTQARGLTHPPSCRLRHSVDSVDRLVAIAAVTNPWKYRDR
jgi:integrase/recombinase XerC